MSRATPSGSLPAGAQVEGDSSVHRLPAGAKLLALAAASVALLAVDGVVGVCVTAAVVAAAHLVAGLGPRHAWSQVRPLRWFLVVLAGTQWWLVGPVPALVVCTRLVALVALAGVVLATTRTCDVLDAIERAARPLERFGVDAGRLALTLSLAIRAVPAVVEIVARAREAGRARGREHDVRALAVRATVSAMRRAEATGEALRARGLDDQ
ncbi:hypothetical protein GCM10025865_00740 [Paraoerskovia sediminicola]|uniref:Biotin transport system permease protein n=1 Tax=Paraoerskovia sediminicola TaxID=1138587 RepID=A0ABM8FYE1_9CELL|nr:CbiQ family ECF transporter T component [Paraoerskovia sediminicola]BDZ40775.1 hypothetical protein GCM10025865_00740 [Paraoerskovia sediminicola]